MHDIRVIRDDPAAFDAALVRRGLAPMSPEILALDADRRARIAAAETAQADQNKASKEVGAAKARGDDAEFERLRALVGEGIRRGGEHVGRTGHVQGLHPGVSEDQHRSSHEDIVSDPHRGVQATHPTDQDTSLLFELVPTTG